ARDRKQEALRLLEKAGSGDPEMLLSRANILSEMNRADEADRVLREIEAKWPEWDRAWVAHGILLERSHPAEAARKLRTALALGSRDPAAACALARLAGSSAQSTAGTAACSARQ
ncbi:MAG TPA: hypothetical protein VHB50_09350, partial [Bryobacteraceae bacterium]|nr:hypothetical protein [Bryobacteraceae bacterium]